MLSLWLYCFLGILTATKSLARPDTSPVRKLARQQNPPDTTINYTFDATSSRNIAVYFGRTNATSTTTLFAQCADPNIDLVILAFVTNVFAGGGYPSISFDGLCGNRTTEMRREGASGLLSCSGLAEQVVRCQGLGKKVLLAGECLRFPSVWSLSGWFWFIEARHKVPLSSDTYDRRPCCDASPQTLTP